MEDAVDVVELEIGVSEVEPANVEPVGVRLLLGNVVVVGEGVDADDLVAARLERSREGRADEAGRAGDDLSHLGTIP